MEGGIIIHNTINHFIRIGREGGIQTVAKELKKFGVKEEVIEEITNNAKKKYKIKNKELNMIKIIKNG